MSKLKLKFLPITLLLIFAAVAAYFSFVQINSLKNEKNENQQKLLQINQELETLKNTDQIKRNEELNQKIKNIENSYQKAVSTYEELLKFKETASDTKNLDILFTQGLTSLSEQNFDSANQTFDKLISEIKSKQTTIASTTAPIPANIPVNNSPPGAGYSRQQISTSIGSYLVSLVAADLSSTKVLVDTASDGDCTNNCPVLPLAEYVTRTGAFAGINGSYFCPAEYPTCAGKTNSYDLLVMNYKKTYFNSANNVYSNNPVVIFGDGYVRFIGAASGWGRDTSPTGVLSNYPLLVSGNNITFGGDDDPKKGSKGNRSFVANKGNTVYIGVVHSATVAESAVALHALGMENALNLDNGGSTALYSGGYKLGPGRNLPNAILFVKK